MSLKKDNKHVAVTEFSLWMMNKGTEELKGTNTECMAEHRNEVLIVFSLSLSLAFVYTCIDIVPVGTMHVIKHTFIPSFWKLTIVILIKSKHACTSRPNQTDFNNLLKAAAEWTFFQSQYLLLNCRANLRHLLYPTTNIAIRDPDHISPISVKHYQAVQPFGKWMIITNSETLFELWKFAST